MESDAGEDKDQMKRDKSCAEMKMKDWSHNYVFHTLKALNYDISSAPVMSSLCLCLESYRHLSDWMMEEFNIV